MSRFLKSVKIVVEPYHRKISENIIFRIRVEDGYTIDEVTQMVRESHFKSLAEQALDLAVETMKQHLKRN